MHMWNQQLDRNNTTDKKKLTIQTHVARKGIDDASRNFQSHFVMCKLSNTGAILKNNELFI